MFFLRMGNGQSPISVPKFQKLKNLVNYNRRMHLSNVLDKSARIDDLLNFMSTHSKVVNSIIIKKNDFQEISKFNNSVLSLTQLNAGMDQDRAYVAVMGGLQSSDGSWSFRNSSGDTNYTICITKQRLIDFGTVNIIRVTSLFFIC